MKKRSNNNVATWRGVYGNGVGGGLNHGGGIVASAVAA